MADLSRYFDNAATTPVDPSVRDAMLPFLDEDCGNAHSIHSFGLRAHEAVERAREQVALLLDAEDPSEVVFTSGATESNNWVLRYFKNAAVGPMEHSSVRACAEHYGHEILIWNGLRIESPKAKKDLISVVAVNNETGQMFDPKSMGENADLLHSDITQALGKTTITVEGLGLASFSAHKLYGPKGVGGLFVRSGISLDPLIIGGGQEGGLRSGTANVPGIVGLGEACRIARDRQPEDFLHARQLRAAILDQMEGLSDWQENGGPNVSPFILSLSFRGVEGETLVLELDRQGFAISAGAACSSGKTEPSPVLLALGLEPEWLRGTVRVSFGRSNTLESAGSLGQVLKLAVGTLRTIKV